MIPANSTCADRGPANLAATEPAQPSDLDRANDRIAAQDATIQSLANRPAPQAAAPIMVEQPLGPMPDPTTKPEELATWMAERMTNGPVCQVRFDDAYRRPLNTL